VLAGTLTGAARELVHAVASPAVDAPARQAASAQAASALAELAALAGVLLPARDGMPEVVTKRKVVPAAVPPAEGSAAATPRPPVTAWARSAERSTGVAAAGEMTLAVTRHAGGGWLPAVYRPGAPDISGPVARTRIAAQQWAEQHYGRDETEETCDETTEAAATAAGGGR
jgi:hypothetical protein